ncbi:hypothetical protein COLO4_00012 [Corchorus olitorius]|uniref:Uncharacterized protein n=1 Tax=Corchorus olitorius TaxID=93759 RepID=A0A1R3L4U5_9ROSI|nr:hypothetical protein COLO4_00012 [Corchorus olitorius]
MEQSRRVKSLVMKRVKQEVNTDMANGNSQSTKHRPP